MWGSLAADVVAAGTFVLVCAAAVSILGWFGVPRGRRRDIVDMVGWRGLVLGHERYSEAVRVRAEDGYDGGYLLLVRAARLVPALSAVVAVAAMLQSGLQWLPW